jgi:uncharacterized protein (TIGR00730 family)
MIDKNSELKKTMESCKEKNNNDIIKSRICVINEEFKHGFDLMKKYPKSVTIFGSARLPEDDVHSKNATELARRLSELGYAIATGGGHGIMGAAHKGSHLADGPSIGINIELPFEQTMNEYITDYVDFHHFFSRKVILSYSAEAYIYFAGGFGTMDELFEILTLIQTRKIPKVPVILFGSSFWNPLNDFIKKTLLEDNKTISKEDMDIYIITDDIDEAVRIVKKTPIRSELHMH